MTITRDEDVLGGEPRIEGSRVGVRHVAARVIEGGQSPAQVADQVDVSLSEVYEALSYYYSHIEEMREFERTNETAFDRVRESSPKPKRRPSDGGADSPRRTRRSRLRATAPRAWTRCGASERPVRGTHE